MNMSTNMRFNSGLKPKDKIKIVLAVIGLIATLGSALIASAHKWLPLLTRPTSPSIAINEREVDQMIEKWRVAWERADWQAYSEFYDPNFSGRNYSQGKGHRVMTRSEWLEDKAKKFSLSPIISIQLGPKTIACKGDRATVSFTQSYQSNIYADSGLKKLLLQKQANGRIQILNEDFIP